MDFMKAFMDQHMIAMMGEIVLFANTVTIAMPTRWRGNMVMDMASKFFNRIGISGGVYGGFIHLDVDREKVQEVMWLY